MFYQFVLFQLLLFLLLYQSLLLIPAVFFVGLIFAMSVTVISNVFQVSANQRMNEFGILKCVGGTIKQIKETREAIGEQNDNEGEL